MCRANLIFTSPITGAHDRLKALAAFQFGLGGSLAIAKEYFDRYVSGGLREIGNLSMDHAEAFRLRLENAGIPCRVAPSGDYEVEPPQLTVDDLQQLLLLHKAVMIAKFYTGTPDRHLQASQPLASVAAAIVATLEAMEKHAGKQAGADAWKEWRRAEGRQIECQAVRDWIDACADWNNWDRPTKLACVTTLFQPLVASEEFVATLVDEGDKKHSDKQEDKNIEARRDRGPHG